MSEVILFADDTVCSELKITSVHFKVLIFRFNIL
jgi:hypothetical protein